MSERPVRLKLSRKAGFSLQAHSLATNGLPAVNVARPSVWGNPFVIGAPSGCDFEDGGDPTPMVDALSRDQVVQFYRNAVEGYLKPEMHPAGHRWLARFRERCRGMSPAEAARSYLKGRNLACRCDLHEACHADVLLRLANGWSCDPIPVP
ncbi:DUF4326 domain-containing protein [Methylobacterium sp. Leaf100]|uniref:DUF4326 domain-containing protein n=1 Tax=Methylobacterium sp. Leaf100 TaxID=1736252 RepID=UPI0006FF81A9|nr:DUF4326 domain-containing protein [Methylobacterium sp. Leaf100]KQP31409.1 hypothetical protein ASF25_18455 [Methylobacterium sp. Leaf100]